MTMQDQDKIPGVSNQSADNVARIDEAWSDTNLDYDYTRASPGTTFSRLKCRVCGSILFEVMATGDYETSARCTCGTYYIVHSG